MVTAAADPFSIAADLLDPPTGSRYNEYVPHWPHPPQEAFLGLEDLEALYGGAAGGGKSDALLMAATGMPGRCFVDLPGYSAIIFRRISPDLHGADGLVPRSKEWFLPILGERAWNSQHLTWTFPSGATLRFGHMQYEDDRFKYQGHAYQFIGFDELTHFTQRQYRYMFSRLRQLTTGAVAEVPLRVRGASNPGGVGHEWVKNRLVDQKVDPKDPEDTEERAKLRVFIPAKLDDNPSINKATYMASLMNLDPEERQQLIDGNWDARQPGDWFFEDLTGTLAYGKVYERLLSEGQMPPPAGGVLDLGIDWGESTHILLGWPLEGGGYFIARELASAGEEVGQKTIRALNLNEWDIPWGRAFFDAAGVQSQKTFNATAEELLGWERPSAKSIPFGAQAVKTSVGAKKSFKGVGAGYLRTLVRRANKGRTTQVLAISPECPALIRQMKLLAVNFEDSSGAWLKDDDQHGPDALVALVTTTANRLRAAIEAEAAAGNIAEVKANGTNGHVNGKVAA